LDRVVLESLEWKEESFTFYSLQKIQLSTWERTNCHLSQYDNGLGVIWLSDGQCLNLKILLESSKFCRNFLEVRNSIYQKFFYLVFWIFITSSRVLLLRKFTHNMVVMLVFNVFRRFCLLRDRMCGIFNIAQLFGA